MRFINKEFLDSIKTGDTVSVVVPTMSSRRESEVIEVVLKRGKKYFTVIEGRASIMGSQFSIESGVKTSQTNYQPFIIESEESYRAEVDRSSRQQRVLHALGSLQHKQMTLEEITQLEAIEKAILER